MFSKAQQVANRTKGMSQARTMKRARSASSVAAAKAAKAATLTASAAQVKAQVAAQNAATAAQIAAQNAASAAQVAAQNASDAAQTAAQTAAVKVRKGVDQGVYGARRWAAPRLESAADYTTKTAAPKVSSALKKTARQVQPPKAHSKRSVLGWTAVGAAILAAIGAAAAVARYRYRTAIVADGEQPAGEQSDGKAETRSDAPASSADANADTSVNGRVTTSNW
jgi:trimeric autotransporter adhesin